MSGKESAQTPPDAAWLFKVGKKEQWGAIEYRITTKENDPESYLWGNFYPDSGEFKIEMIRSGEPGVGMGQALLKRALSEAQKAGAERIKATIVTLECMNLMREVFGDETVKVSTLLELGQGGVSAFLDFPLPTTEPRQPAKNKSNRRRSGEIAPVEVNEKFL